MAEEILDKSNYRSFSKRQSLFFRYTLFILIDLTVLNLFEQFWDNVYIENFLISLIISVFLQFLLQITIGIENRVADYFKKKSGFVARVLRGATTWGILFGSKLIILEAIDLAFGDDVLFTGRMDGLIAFIVVVLTMIVVEQAFVKVFRALE